MNKTDYFTEQTIDSQSKVFLQHLESQYGLHKDKLIPSKAALLILDMQRFFNDEDSHAFIPSAEAIIKPIQSLSEIFIENNLPVITTRHFNTKENAKQMDYWWRDILTEDSKFSKIIPEFDLPGVKVVNKLQYDAFYGTNLNELLHKNNIEQVIITGVMTHLCCETTARSAFVSGYNIFFPIDGTATYNENIHQASLTTLAHGFANITFIKDLLDAFDV